MRRHLVLPDRGQLMVSTDLHGNSEDFRALRKRFVELTEQEPDVHWVLLGDLVHGPDDQAALDQPELYLFEDRSWQIVEELIALQQEHPQRVHFVLGNHDHGHVGGPRLAKFYPDEAAQLESTLQPVQLEAMRELFAQAWLLVLAPCGLLLSHGSPAAEHFDLELLEQLSLEPGANSPEGAALLRSILTSYGQSALETAAVLERAAAQSGLELGVVVHGHDRDEEGWYAEEPNQLCPVLFGAARQAKRYLELDLAGRYRSVEDIREGVEILRLYAV